MSEYYVPSGSPSTGASGASAAIRAEFTALSAGFDKLPTMTGNGDEVVVVNAGGTALTTVPASSLSGLGTMSSQNANNVNVTGGNINNVAITNARALTSSNATITGGSITNLTALTTNNATITGGSIGASTALGIIDAAGDILQGSAADTIARLAIGASGTRLHSTGTLAEWQGTWFKVGTFTRDLTAASANVSYTSVGFKPKAIVLLSGASGGATYGSVGFTDGTTDAVWYNNFSSSADSWVIVATNSINVTTGSGDSQVTTISSFDADGFTLSWTKIGSPTGTATVTYLALR